MTDDRQEWWGDHPELHATVEALDGLVIATAVRAWGLGEPVRLPLRSENRDGIGPRSLAVLERVRDVLHTQPLGALVTVAAPEVRRVIDGAGRKRTCVVVELRRGLARRALVIDTEAP